MKKILSFLLIFIFVQVSFTQEVNKRLEKKIEKEKYHAVERMIKKVVRRNKKGQKINNGSTTYTSHSQTIENIVIWLNKHEGVEGAFSDKCSIKISIYPGWSVIGVKYKKHTKEICYYIQEGKLGNIKIGKKIRFHIFPSRNVLKYIKSYETEGFIAKEKANCLQN